MKFYNMIKFIIFLVVASILLFNYVIFKMSSFISRLEETMYLELSESKEQV